MVTTLPPREVRASFALWLGVVATSVLGNLLVLTVFDRVLDASGTPPDGRVAAYGTLVAVVLATVAGGLVLAVRMRSGASWARWVLAAIGVVYLVTDVVGLFGEDVAGVPGPMAAVLTVLTVVEVVLLAGAVGLLFAPAAQPWFQ
ncbi:hypothetical protein [Pseudonocardia sp.]|uniref:hypothetical protein n=1 Tax=Pseudonocardia sp. TaxID=60912 RepID=UPI003D0D2B09